jgi:pyridoxal phosphate-dependent aminotransferase EpsN
MPQSPSCFSTHWLSCFLIDAQEFGCSRDQLIAHLDASGIESRPVWKPMHLQRFYSDCEIWGGAVAKDLFERGICLPSSSSLTPEEQNYVVERLLEAPALTRAAGTTAGVAVAS